MVDVSEDYKEYCLKFKATWNYLAKYSKDLDTCVDEICELRLYFDSKDRWKSLLSQIGVLYIEKGACDYGKLKSAELKDLGLFTDDGSFLLEERYIIAVKDMLGNIIALIGWYPDRKKYITTPSKYFVRDCLFLGMEQLSKTGLGEPYFLVEGVFDSLSLRALGFNAVAMMGVECGRIKQVLYGLFGRVVAIPDTDNTGRKVIESDRWRLPLSGSYFRWKGSFNCNGEDIPIKDIDMLCNVFEEKELKELLSSCIKSKGKVLTVEF